MSSPASKTPEVPALVSVEEYLRQERAAVFKHEYFNGEVRPMAGASYAHNLICSNLAAAISQHLRGSSGRVVGSTQRVHVAAPNTFCYPDLAVVSGAPEFLDETQETLLNPALLVQIVTPAPNGAWDGRFGLYRQLPSLQQFVLLHSTQAYAEWYWRDEQGRWLLTDTNAQPGVLELPGIGCEVPLAEVYAGVQVGSTA